MKPAIGRACVVTVPHSVLAETSTAWKEVETTLSSALARLAAVQAELVGGTMLFEQMDSMRNDSDNVTRKPDGHALPLVSTVRSEANQCRRRPAHRVIPLDGAAQPHDMYAPF